MMNAISVHTMLMTTRPFNPFRTGLLLFLIITAIHIAYFPKRAANDPSEIDYYLTKDRWDYPYTQFKLKSEVPTGSESYKIKHPNNFIWRTDFQPSGLNFSSGQWTSNLWLETNETATCKLSLGLFTGYLGYVPITEPKSFTLDQTSVQKHAFTFENVDAFTVPEGGCFAIQINATLANLYLDSQNQPSNVHYSLQIISTTSATTTTDFTTTQTQTQTQETFTSQSASEPISPPTTTTLTGTHNSTSTIIGENHFSLVVHAHPQEIEYPSEPSSELKVQIHVDYQIDGIRKKEIKETLFFLEVDKNTTVALNLSSFPTDFIWVEWDNYGLGRTHNTTILIHMDTNRNAIAYFANTTFPIATSTNPDVTVVVVPGFSDLSIIVGLLCAVTAILLTRSRGYQYFKR
ncbi:hypothetical protein [[Eubacterium] cellulosolvens]